MTTINAALFALAVGALLVAQSSMRRDTHGRRLLNSREPATKGNQEKATIAAYVLIAGALGYGYFATTEGNDREEAVKYGRCIQQQPVARKAAQDKLIVLRRQRLDLERFRQYAHARGTTAEQRAILTRQVREGLETQRIIERQSVPPVSDCSATYPEGKRAIADFPDVAPTRTP